MSERDMGDFMTDKEAYGIKKQLRYISLAWFCFWRLCRVSRLIHFVCLWCVPDKWGQIAVFGNWISDHVK